MTLLIRPLNNKKIKKIPKPIDIRKISIPKIPFFHTSRNKVEKFSNISIIYLILFNKNSSSPGLKINTFFHLTCFNTNNTFSLIHIRLD